MMVWQRHHYYYVVCAALLVGFYTAASRWSLTGVRAGIVSVVVPGIIVVLFVRAVGIGTEIGKFVSSAEADNQRLSLLAQIERLTQHWIDPQTIIDSGLFRPRTWRFFQRRVAKALPGVRCKIKRSMGVPFSRDGMGKVVVHLWKDGKYLGSEYPKGATLAVLESIGPKDRLVPAAH